ncbi:MAG: FtsW/RodA/SpoVE family cell cycle protein [Planctomycetota bacterium]|nr:FtsW/RodA/SpoVE family cell cycle protein [Planctomycetota bacterium]
MARTDPTPPTLPAGPPGRSGWVLSIITLAMLGLGVIMVHSALARQAEPGAAWYARREWKHTVYAALSALIVMTAWRVDYRRIARRGGLVPFWPAAFLASAILLAAAVHIHVPGLPFGGHAVGNRWRWLQIGSFQFQPSELVKVGLLIFLAAWLTRMPLDRRKSIFTFLLAIVLIGLCLAPILHEDLSVSIQISASACAALWLAGIPWYFVISLVLAGGAGMFALVYLSPRNWDRILVMSDPLTTTRAAGHQLKQSLLSILSGDYLGKGLGNGAISTGGYLPEPHTDFIFATYCEEFGLAGASLLMLLMILWIYQAHRAAVRSNDPFGRALAGSLGAVYGLQMVLHMAVDLGSAPPTGMVLPFISYGGTALLVAGTGTAMILSVASRAGQGPLELPP